MDFSTAVSKGLNNIGNFEGRSGRAEFWWFVLAVWIIEVVLFFIISLIFRNFFGNLLEFIIWVVAFLAIVSAAVRRLHDVGQSGWMAILWLIPCVFIVPLVFSVQAGTPGDNAYGPPPTA